MSQLICHSKNNIASQNKQHDIHFILILNEACDFSYSFDIHVLNEAHDFSYSFDIHVLNEAHDFPAVRMQLSTLIHSIFLILPQFYLTTVLLRFHSSLSCASCILLSLRTTTFFKKETFVMNTALSWLLVSLDYSPCASQIYISAHSFIALRKFIFFTLISWVFMSL